MVPAAACKVDSEVTKLRHAEVERGSLEVADETENRLWSGKSARGVVNLYQPLLVLRLGPRVRVVPHVSHLRLLLVRLNVVHSGRVVVEFFDRGRGRAARGDSSEVRLWRVEGWEAACRH